MIDLTTGGTVAAPSPPVPAERRDEAGPPFAILLAQASLLAQVSAGQEAPAPGVEPAIAALQSAPVPLAEGGDAASAPIVVDHAIRFDARGMIAMATRTVGGTVEAPFGAPSMADAGAGVAVPFAMLRDPVAPRVVPSGLSGAATATATATAVPVERAVSLSPSAVAQPAMVSVPGAVRPNPVPPDEPEVAPAPVTRPRPRFATMAQGAPQVAVVALADGLAVSAAVGALSNDERHRLRDAIAAALSRHGLRPRAVTLLAMPAPVLSTER